MTVVRSDGIALSLALSYKGVYRGDRIGHTDSDTGAIVPFNTEKALDSRIIVLVLKRPYRVVVAYDSALFLGGVIMYIIVVFTDCLLHIVCTQMRSRNSCRI